MKWRPIIFSVIILICIVSMNYAIYWMITEQGEEEIESSTVSIDTAAIVNQFNLIFDNTINMQEYNIGSVLKQDNAQELVYTKTNVTEKVEGKYKINVNIPTINIRQSKVDDINEEIQQVFYSKAASLISNENQTTLNQLQEQTSNLNTTIYNVQYKAYINSNILSLIIRATLKEGANEQRVIITTYNYNLTTNEEIKLDQLKEIKGISTQTITEEIQKTIKQANEQASNLESLGYSVLYRDPEDEIYDIEKSNDSINCFLGENSMLYIVYPYGNRENTSEMDLILFE